MSQVILPITFSEEAKKEIIALLTTTQLPVGLFLRVGTAGGGCAGVRYVIGFDEKRPHDRLVEADFPVLIAAKDYMHLLGKRIDFLDNGNETGFVFSDDYEAG